ncbi:hypothetical protein ACH51_06180 [Ralstonia solanacearum]|nr:hypothetical protein ACH51_06180 [Ralstonia solanacearum]
MKGQGAKGGVFRALEQFGCGEVLRVLAEIGFEYGRVDHVLQAGDLGTSVGKLQALSQLSCRQLVSSTI